MSSTSSREDPGLDDLLDALQGADDASDIVEGEVPSLPLDGDRGPRSKSMRRDVLRNVRLRVQVELGRTRMPLGRALDLDSGTVVELDRDTNEPVTILVNRIPIARGQLLVVEDRFCVRVTEILAGADEPGAEVLGGRAEPDSPLPRREEDDDAEE